MVKDCKCSCKERSNGPKEWKDLTIYRIAELDILRGLPGFTDVTSFMAKDKEDAIGKYYKQNPGASKRILIYPEGCGIIYTKPIER